MTALDPRWPNLRSAPDEPVKLPSGLWQCDAFIGSGYDPRMPDLGCRTRRHKTVRFADADRVSGWLTSLDAWPTHHRFIAIHRCSPEWRPVELAEIPDPIRVEDVPWEDA